MKKIILLTVFSLFIFSESVKASHVMGGSIRFECLPATGFYVFHMEVYRSCQGIPLQFQNETVNIMNAPYPTNGVRSITMKPDMNTFLATNSGTYSDYCRNDGGLNCAAGDGGTIQRFPYRSDPIQITGTPPSNGWYFVWESACCFGASVNANIPTSGIILRTAMFPYRDPQTNQLQDVALCYDDSPLFLEDAPTVVCTDLPFTYNPSAIDVQYDDLRYSWDTPLAGSVNIQGTFAAGSNPTTMSFNNGYAFSNFTPDQNFNAANQAVSLDSLSGEMKLLVSNGTTLGNYSNSLRVDAYRDGQLINSVWRDLPLHITTCPTLTSGLANNVPSFSINGTNQTTYHLEAFAGENISVPISVVDNDVVTGSNPPLQVVNIIPKGGLFSTDFATSTFCRSAGTSPCATLNPPPIFDSLRQEFKLSAFSGVNTTFNWQADCSHLPLGADSKTHYFVLEILDDHCPIPGKTYATIAVTVRPPGYRDTVRLCSGSNYALPNGTVLQNITASSVQNSRITNQPLCDSLIITHIEVGPPIITTTVNGNTITSDAQHVSYQWIDCATNQPINGATNQSFTPTVAGNYAVIVDQMGCTDTSACVPITLVGLDENRLANNVQLMPNPTKGQVTVNLGERFEAIQLTVRNIVGQVVQEGSFIGSDQLTLELDGESGIYFIQLQTADGQNAVLKVVKE